MAGVYGNSAEDRHFEAQLDRYLSSLDEFTCPVCNACAPIDDLEYDEVTDMILCDACGTWVF